MFNDQFFFNCFDRLTRFNRSGAGQTSDQFFASLAFITKVMIGLR